MFVFLAAASGTTRLALGHRDRLACCCRASGTGRCPGTADVRRDVDTLWDVLGLWRMGGGVDTSPFSRDSRCSATAASARTEFRRRSFAEVGDIVDDVCEDSVSVDMANLSFRRSRTFQTLTLPSYEALRSTSWWIFTKEKRYNTEKKTNYLKVEKD